MSIIKIILISIFIIATFFELFNMYTCIRRYEVGEAIYQYNKNNIYKDHIDYATMHTYKHTLLRFYDFGYKNIMRNKNDYEKIKPYIKNRG